jgi:aminotransferase
MNVSKSPRNPVSRLVRDIPRSGIRDFFDIVSTMKDVVSLGIGEPDFVTPWHIREAAIYSLERGRTQYTSNLGTLELRRLLSAYVEKNFGVSYRPENEVLVAVGVSEAFDIALRAILDPGDEVVFHEPCFVSYRPLITLAHAVPVPVETFASDNFRVTAEAIAAKITPKTKALILNFPNNPTGAVMPRAELEKIARLAVEHDLIVLSDEIYAELTYEGTHTSIACLPGMKDRTIFLHGFSKAWAMTGFRLGYACAPAHLVEAMMKIHQYCMMCASITSQEAAVEALKNPGNDVAEMRDSYLRRRNYLQVAFAEMGIPCATPAGAFYAFPQVSQFNLKAKDFAMRLLQEEKVAAVPGTAFGACGEGHIRCSYATSLDQIKVAMERLKRFVGRLG